jgi:hypothetical protein
MPDNKDRRVGNPGGFYFGPIAPVFELSQDGIITGQDE